MKIGIVTISFDQADYLQEAIDSVAFSRAEQLSYVIVDAGSSDGSRALIESNRSHFATIVMESDNGPADGLNKGFAACNGDVFGYLNADDRFVPGALDFVAAWFESHPGLDVLLGAVRIIDADGNPAWRGRAPDRIDVGKLVCGTCFVWQQATFFRREIFQRTRGFNAANRSCWDLELVLDLVLAGASIGYTNTILGDFRIHPGSLTGSGKQALLEQQEKKRMQAKVGARGYRLQTGLLPKLRYKFNMARHYRCAFGTSLPPLPVS